MTTQIVKSIRSLVSGVSKDEDNASTATNQQATIKSNTTTKPTSDDSTAKVTDASSTSTGPPIDINAWSDDTNFLQGIEQGEVERQMEMLAEAKMARAYAEKGLEVGQEGVNLGRQNLHQGHQTLQLAQANSVQLSDVKTTLEIIGQDKIKLQKQAAQSEKKLHRSEKKLQRSEKKLQRSEKENFALAEENSRLKAQLFAVRDEKENKVNRPKAAPKDGKKANEVVKGYDKHTKNLAPGAGEEKAKAKAKEEGRFLH